MATNKLVAGIGNNDLRGHSIMRSKCSQSQYVQEMYSRWAKLMNTAKKGGLKVSPDVAIFSRFLSYTLRIGQKVKDLELVITTRAMGKDTIDLHDLAWVEEEDRLLIPRKGTADRPPWVCTRFGSWYAVIHTNHGIKKGKRALFRRVLCSDVKDAHHLALRERVARIKKVKAKYANCPYTRNALGTLEDYLRSFLARNEIYDTRTGKEYVE